MKQKIKKVAVIGTGTLGTQIAIQAAYYGYEVGAYDEAPGVLPKMIQKLMGTMKFLDRALPCRPMNGKKPALKSN